MLKEAQRRSVDTILLVINIALDGVGGQLHFLTTLSPCKSPAFYYIGGWAPGPVWTGIENRKSLALSRVRTPYRETHSETLIDYTIPAPHNK